MISKTAVRREVRSCKNQGGCDRLYDRVAAVKRAGLAAIVIREGVDYESMFDERFYGVAMGNGCDELKAKADYVAEKNVEDGINKACEAHGWF